MVHISFHGVVQLFSISLPGLYIVLNELQNACHTKGLDLGYVTNSKLNDKKKPNDPIFLNGQKM